jgi:uncharacterized protein
MRSKPFLPIAMIVFILFAPLALLAQESKNNDTEISKAQSPASETPKPITATNPKTGERIQLDAVDRQWRPIPSEKDLNQAEAGNIGQQLVAAQQYFNCHDYKDAAKWYRRAAVQGDAFAQYWIAYLFSMGMGVAIDGKEAAKWYYRSAVQGYDEAEFIIGFLYFSGCVALPQDFREAAEWFLRGAEQGNARAQFYLGICYAQGKGVVQDYVQAYMWFNLAAANASPSESRFFDPVKIRDLSAALLTPAQVAEAQRLSREFRPKRQEQGTFGPQAQEKPEIKYSGTGFSITADGFILTAYHVVKGAARIQIWTHNGLSPAKLVRFDAANDIALLKAEGHRYAALAVRSSRNVKVGEQVFTLGFPNVQFQGTAAKYTQGDINCLSGFADDPRLFQISAAIQPGNSGGPLLQSDGTVVGMVVSKLDEIAVARQTGSLPQNVNYALKSSFILSFLEALPELNGRLSQVRKQGLSEEQIIQESINSVVMVLSY